MSKADEIGERIRTRRGTARGQSSPLVAALGACLRSGDNELRGVALRRLEAALREHDGNVSAAGRALGIPHRTLARWIEEDTDLRVRVLNARKV